MAPSIKETRAPFDMGECEYRGRRRAAMQSTLFGSRKPSAPYAVVSGRNFRSFARLSLCKGDSASCPQGTFSTNENQEYVLHTWLDKYLSPQKWYCREARGNEFNDSVVLTLLFVTALGIRWCSHPSSRLRSLSLKEAGVKHTVWSRTSCSYTSLFVAFSSALYYAGMIWTYMSSTSTKLLFLLL